MLCDVFFEFGFLCCKLVEFVLVIFFKFRLSSLFFFCVVRLGFRTVFFHAFLNRAESRCALHHELFDFLLVFLEFFLFRRFLIVIFNKILVEAVELLLILFFDLDIVFSVLVLVFHSDSFVGSHDPAFFGFEIISHFLDLGIGFSVLCFKSLFAFFKFRDSFRNFFTFSSFEFFLSFVISVLFLLVFLFPIAVSLVVGFEIVLFGFIAFFVRNLDDAFFTLFDLRDLAFEIYDFLLNVGIVLFPLVFHVADLVFKGGFGILLLFNELFFLRFEVVYSFFSSLDVVVYPVVNVGKLFCTPFSELFNFRLEGLMDLLYSLSILRIRLCISFTVVLVFFENHSLVTLFAEVGIRFSERFKGSESTFIVTVVKGISCFRKTFLDFFDGIKKLTRDLVLLTFAVELVSRSVKCFDCAVEISFVVSREAFLDLFFDFGV